MGGVNDGERSSALDHLVQRGRIDKRQAILDAAFQVFAREGYAQASVDEIAAHAGVAKPTIYNHMGGKENLFRQVMADTAERSSVRSLAALAAFPAAPVDLRSELLTVARALVACFCDERSTTLRRLLHAEILRFPDLFDTVRASAAEPFIDALAGRLARLSNGGHLRITDPVRAANQFLALISSEVQMLSALGTRTVGDAELEDVVRSGVDTFLRAFAAPPAGIAPP